MKIIDHLFGAKHHWAYTGDSESSVGFNRKEFVCLKCLSTGVSFHNYVADEEPRKRGCDGLYFLRHAHHTWYLGHEHYNDPELNMLNKTQCAGCGRSKMWKIGTTPASLPCYHGELLTSEYGRLKE